MSQITANFNPNSSQKIGITFNNTITPLKLTPSARSTVESWGYDASQINSLDIPLGASSYSHGVFLFDFDGFSKLSSASSQAFTLNMNAADQNVLVSHYTGQYYLHRVENLHEASEGFGLYLAHFVDSRRYAASKLWTPTSASGYGQTAHQNRANYIGGSSASLQSLLTAAMGQWGSGTVVNAIDSSYNALDWGLTKNITTEPVATIIDRICKLTGLVISGDQNAYSYASSTLVSIRPAA